MPEPIHHEIRWPMHTLHRKWTKIVNLQAAARGHDLQGFFFFSNSTRTAGVCEQKPGWDTQEAKHFVALYHSNLKQILILQWNVETLTWNPAVMVATPQYSQGVIGYDERRNPKRLVWITNESKDHAHTDNHTWHTVLPPRTSTPRGNCCSTLVGLSAFIYVSQHHCWFRLVALKAKPVDSTITQSSAVSMQRQRAP